MNKKELIELLETIKIDREEFWILSSSALVLRDIYPDAGDADIAVTDKGLEQGYQEVHSIIQQYQPKQKIERNEVKEEKKEIPLPKNKEPFPVPKYKHISSLDEIAQYSKSEQIKRLYHNNLFLYEELSNLKKENELLKQQLKNKVTENDQRAKEEDVMVI